MGLVGIVFGLLSLALPVGEIRSILGLSHTFYGFTTDVVISFVILLIALGTLVTSYKRWKPITVFILVLIALFVVGAVISKVNVAAAEATEEGVVSFSYGPGIFFALIAPITFMIGAWLMAKEKPTQAT